MESNEELRSDWSLEKVTKAYKDGRISRRKVLRLGAALGLSLPVISGIVAAACGDDGDEGAPTPGAATPGAVTPGATPPPAAKKGGTLIFAAESEMDILDPHAQLGFVTWRVNGQMYEGLVGRNLTKPSELQPPEFVPTLAESWEISDDFREFNFKLREGVLFHDGSEWNEEVAKANLGRIWDPESKFFFDRAAGIGGWHDDLANIKSIETPGPMQLRLTFENPYPDFFWNWTEGGIGMPYFISLKALTDIKAEEIGENPVGTGPFQFVERERGVKIVLARNDNYWGTTPPRQPALLDQLIIRPLPEATTRVISLQTGEVDMIISPPPDAIDPLVSRGFELSITPVAHRWWVYINFKEPLMQNQAVRRALFAAIDREGMSHDLLKGTATAAFGYLTPGFIGYDPAFRPSWFGGGGAEEAKQILAEGGFPDGVDDEIVFLLPSSGSGMIQPIPMAEWMQRNWADAGFNNVKIQTQDFIAWANTVYIPGLPKGVHLSALGGGDAPSIFNTWSCKFHPPNGANNGFYCNEKVDELLESAFVETDETKRTELIKQAHEILMDDVGYLVTVNDNLPFLLNPKVQGWVHPGFNWFDFRTVSIDESKDIT